MEVATSGESETLWTQYTWGEGVLSLLEVSFGVGREYVSHNANVVQSAPPHLAEICFTSGL